MGIFKNSNSLKALLVGIVVAAVVAGGVYLTRRMPTGPEFQKGMGYVTWSHGAYDSAESDASLERLAELGVEWVAIHVTWYQTTSWSGDIHRTGKTPSDDSVRRAIRKAHDLGMSVMLKPHLDLLDKSDGSWRGEIGCPNEEEWRKWFAAYEEYMEHYINMANEENVAMFCVGTELSSAATVKGYMWRDMIKRLRNSYRGKMTYAAHWDRYADIRFWDLLDYVGINAYFPLSKELTPSYDDLLEGWKRWLPEIEEFQERVGKPIIFPEIGSNSADGAAIRPWEHHPRTEVNLDLQRDYYEALLETFWGKDWFYGLYWWYWGTNVNMGGPYSRNFVPQNKPAEDVLAEWYGKPVPR